MKIDWEEIRKNPDKYEVKYAYYLAPVISEYEIKMIRFNLEMQQHYREEQEKHELLIYAMKLGLIK